MKKKFTIGALHDPKTLKPIKYVVTPVTDALFPGTPLFMGTEEECKEFVKNYKEEKSKSRLTFFQKIKYIAIAKYYEYIFPIFSDELEKERMQVAAFIIDAKNTKHWSKYQTALQTLKFGPRQAPDVTTIIKDANRAAPKVLKQEPVVPVPEVQAAIDALVAEAKNPQPWTGAATLEEGYPLNLTDKIINESKK